MVRPLPAQRLPSLFGQPVVTDRMLSNGLTYTHHGYLNSAKRFVAQAVCKQAAAC